MIPTETIKRLHEAMRDIAAAKGNFTLFGVFMRGESADAWDLVVAAPWLDAGRLKAVRTLADLLSDLAGDDLLRQLSSIQTLEEGDPTLEAILAAVNVDDGEVRVQRSNFSGMEIEDAVILRARRAA